MKVGLCQIHEYNPCVGKGKCTAWLLGGCAIGCLKIQEINRN